MASKPSLVLERFEQAGSIARRAVGRGQLPADTPPEQVIEGIAAPVWFRLMVSRTPVTDPWLSEIVGSVLETARSPRKIDTEDF